MFNDKTMALGNDLLSRAVSALFGMRERDTDNVLRIAGAHGTGADVERAVRLDAQHEWRQEAVASIADAPGLPPAEQAGARGAVLDALEQGNGQPASAGDRLGPQLDALNRRAEEAKTELANAREHEENALGKEKSQERRFARHRGKHGTIAQLAQRLAPLLRKRALLYTLEACTALAIALAFCGVLDGSITDVSFGTWAQVLVLTAGLVVCLVVLTRGARAFLIRFRVGTGGIAVVGLLLTLVAVGVIRWTASRDTSEVTPFMSEVSSIAVVIIGAVVSLLVAVLIARCDEQIEAIRAQMEELRPLEDQLATNAGKAVQEREALQARRRNLEAAVEAPGKLEAWFVAASHDTKKRYRDWEAATEERVERVKSAFAHVSQLDDEALEALRAELFRVEQLPDGGAHARATATRALSFFLLCSSMASPMLSGCSSAATPTSTVIVCDGSGSAPEDTCTSEFLQRAAASIAKTAVTRPGSCIMVVTTADAYATTLVHKIGCVPERWRGDVRAARASWMRAVVAAAAEVPIPTDANDKGTKGASRNVSDGFAALAVAQHVTRDLVGHELALVLATDGLAVGAGLNFERSIPSVQEVRDRLAARHVPLDLTPFDRIMLCGLHHHGLEPEVVEARRAVWTELLRVGDQMPTLRNSCKDVFAPVPSGLLRHAAGEEG